MKYRPCKHKDVVTTLSQLRMIGYIEVVCSLEMKVLPTSVGNVMVVLKSRVIATLRQLSAKVLTTVESRKFTSYFKTSF